MNKNDSKSLTTLFGKPVKGYVLVGTVASVLGLGFVYSAGMFTPDAMTAQKFVDLQENGLQHSKFRRAHAKGVCIAGQFNSNGALEKLSRSEVFKTGVTPIYGRFSIGGGNPAAPDLKSPVRSLALVFSKQNDQQWRMAMNTPPVMTVRTAEKLYEQFVAMAPNPKTGIQDQKAVTDFFKNHPESNAFIEWKNNYKPTNSFLTEIYHSINAFYLVNAKGERQAVRWTAEPKETPEYLTDDSDKNYLQNNLFDKLKNGPISFELVFSLAQDGDLVDDPTSPWPNSRTKITAGTIQIRSAEPQDGGICDGINFDPLVLPDGIEPSNDPILRSRSAAYAESYRRRARETFLENKP